MPTTPATDIRLSSQHSRTLLDGLLESVAELIPDPLDCDAEVRMVVDRLVYLVTRGPARDGRRQMLASIGQAAAMLLNEELRRDTGSMNYFAAAEVFNITPRQARELFAPRDEE